MIKKALKIRKDEQRKKENQLAKQEKVLEANELRRLNKQWLSANHRIKVPDQVLEEHKE